MNDDFLKLASHDKYYKALVDLIKSRTSGKVGPNDIKKMIECTLNKKLTSAQALDYLASKIKKEKISEEYITARNNARVNDVLKYVGAFKNIKTYMDIGCGDGSTTSEIGKTVFKLDKENIIGIDVESWAGHDHADAVVDSITFRQIETPGIFPVETDSVDAVTINMVLHHIPDDVLTQTMSELYRCLTVGGVIFLREHDSPNHMVDSLINIEHGLFEVSLEQLSSGDKFQKTYYGRYKPRRDWVELFEAFGYTQVGAAVTRTTGTRPFIAIFQKNSKHSNIVNMTASELRMHARTTGINTTSALPAEGVKRAIIAGRRK